MRPEEIAGLIGEDAALHLMARRGGQRMYVPASITSDLLNAVGDDRAAAERFAAEHGKSFVIVPIAKRWRALLMRRRGMSVREVSLALSMSERAIYRANLETSRQPDRLALGVA